MAYCLSLVSASLTPLPVNILNKISQMNTGHYHKAEINTAFPF